MPEVELELLPIAVASIIPMVIGALWYSPLILGNQWLKYAGMTEKDFSAKNPAVAYGLTFLFNIVLSVALFVFLAYASVDTNMEALKFALMIWAGFSLTLGFPNYIFGKNHVATFFIYQAYQLVNLVAMVLILANL
jgi:hypothetical protein